KPTTPSAATTTTVAAPAVVPVVAPTPAGSRASASKPRRRVRAPVLGTLVRRGRFRVACARGCVVAVVVVVHRRAVVIARGPGPTVVLNRVGHRLCARAPRRGVNATALIRVGGHRTERQLRLVLRR